MSRWYDTRVERDDFIDISIEYEAYCGTSGGSFSPDDYIEVEIIQIRPKIDLTKNEEEIILDDIARQVSVRNLTDTIDRFEYFYDRR